MSDPYTVLGVNKTASDADIKSAYRKLAKKYHPDANKGDDKVIERFNEIGSAYEVLKDKEKRGQFDRGEIDAKGNPTGYGADPFGGAGPFGRSAGRGQQGGNPFGNVRAEDIFSEFFSGAQGGGARGGGAQRGGHAGSPFGSGRQRTQQTAGRDIAYTLSVPFMEAMKGAVRRVTLTGGKTLDVKIPQGVADAQQIRLRGQGEDSAWGGKSGDALITVRVEAHPLFEREGSSLRLTLPITIYEAVLGGKVRVPTPSGSLNLTIAPNSSGGKVLRLKGKGVATEKGQPGDLFVTLRIVLPEADSDLQSALEKLAEQNAYSVRGSEFT